MWLVNSDWDSIVSGLMIEVGVMVCSLDRQVFWLTDKQRFSTLELLFCKHNNNYDLLSHRQPMQLIPNRRRFNGQLLCMQL